MGGLVALTGHYSTLPSGSAASSAFRGPGKHVQLKTCCLKFPITRIHSYTGVDMERLPDEVILRILSFLEPRDIVQFQRVSRNCLTLGRDDEVWKTETYNHSQMESQRRRQQLLNVQDSRLTELRNAWDTSQFGTPTTSEAEAQTQRHRALTNW